MSSSGSDYSERSMSSGSGGGWSVVVDSRGELNNPDDEGSVSSTTGDRESEEFIISPHDECETKIRRIIMNKAASLVLSAPAVQNWKKRGAALLDLESESDDEESIHQL